MTCLLKNHLESLPDYQKRVLHIVWAYVVVEVTMDMAEWYGSRWSQQPANVNIEQTIRGFKSDIFDWDQV